MHYSRIMYRSPRTASLTRTVSIVALSLACAEELREPASTADPASSATPSGVAGLVLEADVVVMESFPVQLRGTLRVENPTAAPISFDVGGCPVFLRVYDTAGDLVWDQGDGAVCTMILRTVTLAPEAAESFETATASAADVLGEDHPDGTYRTAVYVALVSGSQPEADAGDVALAVPR